LNFVSNKQQPSQEDDPIIAIEKQCCLSASHRLAVGGVTTIAWQLNMNRLTLDRLANKFI
jgi:hypothetical protein